MAKPLGADDRILIEARLNGQPLMLAFDTGAGELVIFETVATQRGLKINPPAAGATPNPGEVLINRTEPVSIELLGTSEPDVRVGVIAHPAALPVDVDGVLGWPSIRNNIWLLSGSSLKLHVLREVPNEAEIWIKLKELRDRQLLCLELPPRQPGPPVYLGIDTGSDSGVQLSPEAWAKWRAAHSTQSSTLDAYFMPGAGLVVDERVWAGEIDLGGLVLCQVPVGRMNSAMVALHPPRTVAVLGLTAMKRMDTVLDGKNGVAYVHPLDTPPRPYAHNRLGAVFVPVDLQRTDDLVARVAKDSPAAEAGVKEGDILLQIDQLDVTPWRTKPGILPLQRFWTQAPGTKLHLTLRRSGRTVTVDVTLRNILGPAPK